MYHLLYLWSYSYFILLYLAHMREGGKPQNLYEFYTISTSTVKAARVALIDHLKPGRQMRFFFS